MTGAPTTPAAFITVFRFEDAAKALARQVHEIHDDGHIVGVADRLQHVIVPQARGGALVGMPVIGRLPGGEILDQMMDDKHAHGVSPLLLPDREAPTLPPVYAR